MPILVAAAVVRHAGKILLTKRQKGAHLEGFWEFPGGKLEPGEDPESALVRECREECAIEVRPTDILDVTFHRFPSKDVLLLFYECELVSGEVQHLGVAAHAWVDVADLDAYELPPPDGKLVTKLKAGFAARR